MTLLINIDFNINNFNGIHFSFVVVYTRFTENLTPVTVDSAGVVRMLSRSFGSSIWSPVCMTKSNVSSSNFVRDVRKKKVEN